MCVERGHKPGDWPNDWNCGPCPEVYEGANRVITDRIRVSKAQIAGHTVWASENQSIYEYPTA